MSSRAVLAALVVVAVVSCSAGADDGRVAVAELTCATEAAGSTDGACDRRVDETVERHCQQDDVAAVRVTVYVSRLRFTNDGDATVFDEQPLGAEIISKETTEHSC
jgi:hypothetical protein